MSSRSRTLLLLDQRLKSVSNATTRVTHRSQRWSSNTAGSDASNHDPAVPSDSIPSLSSTQSASEYMRAQAALEDELEASVKKPSKVVIDTQAWQGEETMAVLLERVLNDKYKPLRIKGYVKKLPQPAPLPSHLFADPTSSPSTKVDRPTPKHPWDYTFVAPNSDKPPAIRLLASTRHPQRVKSRLTTQQRLEKAKEQSSDYGMGLIAGKVSVPCEPNESEGGVRTDQRRVMGGMRAWSGIVEDKIEQARIDGQFKNLRGRGKPLPIADGEEDNSVVTREEFLMNRIVKRQGVAPPWIELQQELDITLGNFRTELRATWTRRATRMRSLDSITRSTLTEVREGWRDPDWEASQKGYHTESILQLNNLLRRYNVISPYHVRRPLLSMKIELDACIQHCAPIIVEELDRRMKGILPAELEKAKEKPAVEDNVWSAFRRGVREMFG